MAAVAKDVTAPDCEALSAVLPLLELVGSNAPLAELLRALALFVERLTDDLRCSILLYDPLTGTLRHGAAPNLPAAYCAAVDGVAIGEGVGSCGTAAARRAPVIVTDIQSSPLWHPYREFAAEHGVAACWSVPLFDDQRELLGTFAMYYAEPREPTPAELDILRVVGPLGAMVIQRHRDATRVRASEFRYRQLTEASPDAVVAHEQGIIRYVNAAAIRMWGARSAAQLTGRHLREFCAPEALDDLLTLHQSPRPSVLRRTDGTVIPAEVMSTVLDEGGPHQVLLICRDVSERRSLEGAMMDAVQQEQERLGYDLHDGIGQQLAGVSMLLTAVAADVRAGHPGAAGELDQIRSMIGQTLEETRRLATGLAPVTVERAGLAGALTSLGVETQLVYGIRVQVLVTPGAGADLAPARATQFFRIAQEAVRNAVRHGKAGRVRIRLAQHHQELTLTISDDGSGIVPCATQGLGLRGMRYRAERLAGSVSITARKPHGTRVRVRAPLVARRAVDQGPALRATG